jgi:hypothetical protein
MGRRTRTVAVVALVAASATIMAGCRPALSPREPSRVADFTINKVADQDYAGFTVTGDLLGNKNLEIVTTSLNITYNAPINGVPQRPSIVPGSMTLHQGSGTNWTSTKVFDTDAGLVFPNEPTISDVDGDGRNDIIVPSGNFFTRAANPPIGKGAMTWWKNNGDGTFSRNDVATNVNGSYHVAIHVDFDGDGIKDIVTNYEDGGFPGFPFGPALPFGLAVPITKVQYFPGLGGGNFGPVVDLANGGGSLPSVVDMDLDGDFDVASAQYFGVKATPTGQVPPFAPGCGPQGCTTDESFVWFENLAGKNAGPLDSADFTKHVIARGLGESFELRPVDNIDGNGRYGAIGINHVNPNVSGLPGVAAVAPQVVRLTPGADIRQPWNVQRIDSGFTVDDVRPGQAAPGFSNDGDVDGDGDVDIVLSGDSDGTIYWLERKAGGGWAQRDLITEFGGAAQLAQLTTPQPKYPNQPALSPNSGYGQGSVSIADLNRDGRNEIVISSFNSATVEVISRDSGTGGIFPAVPRVPDFFKPY